MCFGGLARQLAKLYRIDTVGEEVLNAGGGGGGGAGGGGGGEAGVSGGWEPACGEEWTLQHVLLPAMRRSYEPPNAHASNGAVVQVACTEQLYKIFERC